MEGVGVSNATFPIWVSYLKGSVLLLRKEESKPIVPEREWRITSAQRSEVQTCQPAASAIIVKMQSNMEKKMLNAANGLRHPKMVAKKMDAELCRLIRQDI